MKPSSLLVLAAVAVAFPTVPGGHSWWSSTSTPSIQGSGKTYGSKSHGNNNNAYQHHRNSGGNSGSSNSGKASSSSTSRSHSSSSTKSASSSPTPSSSSSASSSLSLISSKSASSSINAAVGDDYPNKYKNSCGSIDEWRLTACQCVSFVAWRIDQRLNRDFSRSFDGETWSNANTWASAAREAGLTVDNTPKVGAIAQTNAGEYGHVAWVSAVNGNQIQVEEYNALKNQAYDTRTVSASNFQYIHIPVSSPAS